MAVIEERKMQRHRVSDRTIFKRAGIATIVIVAVMTFGTVGYHLIEGDSWINSFYFMAMLATGEGPATNPVTALGKIFASVMAFVGVGAVVISLIYLFGPFVGRLVKIGESDLEHDEHTVERELENVGKKV